MLKFNLSIMAIGYNSEKKYYLCHMDFRFCPDCGSPLSFRELGDEGMVPWCETCDKPWFPMFPVAMIALVYNEKGEVLLLHQDYISHSRCNLVSGYLKPGEDAETTAIREIAEETGQQVEKLDLVCTRWFERKQMLMIGFLAGVTEQPLRISTEVDYALWASPNTLLDQVVNRPGSVARYLCDIYLKELDTDNIERVH